METGRQCRQFFNYELPSITAILTGLLILSLLLHVGFNKSVHYHKIYYFRWLSYSKLYQFFLFVFVYLATSSW